MYNILSINGIGANHTLIATKILQKIEKKLKEKTGENLMKHFDHIIASSTASLAASLIAFEGTTKKTYEKITNNLKTTFDNIKQSYTSDDLDKLLKDFPDVKMSTAKIPLLMLAAKNEGKIVAHYFSTSENNDIQLFSALKASIAYTLKFPSQIIDNKGYFDYSFIGKSLLLSVLAHIQKFQNIILNQLFVTYIDFDNPNIKDYSLKSDQYFENLFKNRNIHRF